ncbi:MAG: hypothetical protein II855_07660 [Candidatus Methanomethylophilaceae archaeon]|nr:hypothetical protein [Candidatus Methanomethylophilaceae archaeon]
MAYDCAGKSNFGTPTLKIMKCPECGNEIEIFSTDVTAVCENCGHKVYNDINICVLYCAHAEECVGTELYNKLVRYRDTGGVPPQEEDHA